MSVQDPGFYVPERPWAENRPMREVEGPFTMLTWAPVYLLCMVSSAAILRSLGHPTAHSQVDTRPLPISAKVESR